MLELIRGGVCLGRIEIDPREGDFPWRSGRFQPFEAFTKVQPLFERLTRLTGDERELDEAAAAAHEAVVAPRIVLQDLATNASYETDAILIDGDQVKCR
jgi:hypothetical protein